ncbi:hypothetical protein M9H77_31369 [Catharanthus roseus]|uniref:Uncharacterized protein n=1 Tax=Catharanthus roseus TaxID=4058 RepID=A0ACC0A2J6_CATRO|nr:hypothetical protein M9H77_31369 [Catharanthus roseus]
MVDKLDEPVCPTLHHLKKTNNCGHCDALKFEYEPSEWKEIQEQLQPGQRPRDCPYLTSRVFKAKLQDLKDQLFKKEIFRKVAAHVCVIVIKSPDQFDKFVCAELPDKNRFPELLDLVVKHVMHGSCGAKNKRNSCMVNGKFKFHYHRAFL